MPSLHEIQQAFADGMRTGRVDTIASAVVSDRLRAEDRLSIYRNHYALTLTEALEATYPVVRQLVGEPFFRSIANSYIDEFPPTGPCLFEYGAGFSGFIAGLWACRDLPYLPDVARFEWATNLAFHAPDGSAIDPRSLASLPVEKYALIRLRLDPACALLESRYPVSRIWQANQPDADPTTRVNLGDGAERLLICRLDDEVVWRKLDAAEFTFISALRSGRTLPDASIAASSAGTFDLTVALAALLDAHLVIGFDLRSLQP